MTISKKTSATQAFVWIWLPENNEPIVAGRIDQHGETFSFTYGKNYLQEKQAIPLSPFELPLQAGPFFPEGMNVIHSCLRDAAPDAWGRRLINHEYSYLSTSELDYMLLSGSNRIGALDFQLSSTDYIPRDSYNVTLEDLLLVTEYIEHNQPFPKSLHHALLHGTSIGGARPKVLMESKANEPAYIAKFSSTTDSYNIIKAEYIAMRLAFQVGINVPKVHLKKVMGQDILLIERFDRKQTVNGTNRKLMLSGLSLLGLNELKARYASYCDFADVIRKYFYSPHDNLVELYKRLIFNVVIGNNDDHARNHSAFWDGKALELTPAYDLCPQSRTGFETTQAMALEGSEGNLSKLTNVLSICNKFQISPQVARDDMEAMIATVKENWSSVCDEAELNKYEKTKLWGKSILNPFCLQDF